MNEKELEAYHNYCLTEGNKSTDDKAKDSGLSVNQLPNIDYIYKNKGKEGELRAFNNNGKGEAWVYKGGKWEKVGDVIGGEDNSENKTDIKKNNDSGYYPGDEIFPEGVYDYVFDVELQGKVTRLPFNCDGNKLVTAEKFCRREKLHALYKEDIIKFLKANAIEKKKVNINQTNKPSTDCLKLVKLPIVSKFYTRPNICALIR